MRQRVADARDLIGRLDQLRGADDLRGIRRRTRREQPCLRAAHRPGQLVDGDRRARRASGRPAPCRNARRPRRIRGTAARACGRRAPRDSDAEPSRIGMNRCGCSSSASTIATGRSTCESPASSSGQLAPVAYTTLPLPSRTSASTPLSFIESRSLAPHSRYMRAMSGSSGISMAETARRRERGHSTPRNFLMLVLTIFVASSGPTASTTDRQRLLRVAERALVVRVVRRPHHPVHTDPVDQLEPERIDHERGAHVVVPVVRTSCSSLWLNMCW